MGQRIHVRTQAYGRGDGSDFDNAMSGHDPAIALTAALKGGPAGAVVAYLAGETYRRTSAFATLHGAGTPEHRALIRPFDRAGQPGTVVIEGNRRWTPTATSGSKGGTIWALGDLSYVDLAGFHVRHAGTCFRAGSQTVTGVRFLDNVLEDFQIGYAAVAAGRFVGCLFDHGTVLRDTVLGYSKDVVRFGTQTASELRVRREDRFLRLRGYGGQRGDGILTAVVHLGNSSGVGNSGTLIEQVHVRDLISPGSYTQGDLSSGEEYDTDVVIRDSSGTDIGDGIDYKAGVRCERVTMTRAGRSFRAHAGPVKAPTELIDCTSIDPTDHGLTTTGSRCHVWGEGGAIVNAQNLRMVGGGLDVQTEGAVVTLLDPILEPDRELRVKREGGSVQVVRAATTPAPPAPVVVVPPPTPPPPAPEPLQPPGLPTLSVVVDDEQGATLTWAPGPGGEATGWYPGRDDGGVLPYEWESNKPLPLKPLRFTGLPDGGVFLLGVRGVNAAGYGPAASIVARMPAPEPEQPPAELDPRDAQIAALQARVTDLKDLVEDAHAAVDTAEARTAALQRVVDQVRAAVA